MWFLLAMLTQAAPESVLSGAREHEQAGDDARAISVLEDAVRQEPSFSLAQLELGRLMLKAGTQIDQAAWHLDIARSLNPENPRAHYFYALAADEQGRPDEARQSFEVALALRDDFSDAQFRLAGLLFAAGDYAQAASRYQRYVDAHADDVGARLQLASSLERSGSIAEAEKTLRSLFAKPASKAIAGRRLIALLENQGRKADAAKIREAVEPVKKPLRALRPSHR